MGLPHTSKVRETERKTLFWAETGNENVTGVGRVCFPLHFSAYLFLLIYHQHPHPKPRVYLTSSKHVRKDR